MNSYFVYDESGNVTEDNFPYDSKDIIDAYNKLCGELEKSMGNVEYVKDFGSMNIAEGIFNYLLKIITIISNLGKMLVGTAEGASYGDFFAEVNNLLQAFKEMGLFISVKDTEI